MVKLIISSFWVDCRASEHFVTAGDRETAHGNLILWFGMKCVEAQPCSVGHGSFEMGKRLNTLKREENLKRRIQMDETEVCFAGSTQDFS